MINDVIGNGSSKPAPAGTGISAGKAAMDTPGTQLQAPPSASTTGAGNLESAVSQLNDYVQSIQRSLSFSIEESTGRTVVKVFDSQTDELIRQIPPEETLKIAAALQEQTAALFIKERA